MFLQDFYYCALLAQNSYSAVSNSVHSLRKNETISRNVQFIILINGQDVGFHDDGEVKVPHEEHVMDVMYFIYPESAANIPADNL